MAASAEFTKSFPSVLKCNPPTRSKRVPPGEPAARVETADVHNCFRLTRVWASFCPLHRLSQEPGSPPGRHHNRDSRAPGIALTATSHVECSLPGARLLARHEFD